MLQVLSSVGLVGVFLGFVAARKWFVPEWTLRKSEEENERLRAENEKLSGQVTDLQNTMASQLVPALTKSVEAQARYTEELRMRRWAAGHTRSPDAMDGV